MAADVASSKPPSVAAMPGAFDIVYAATTYRAIARARVSAREAAEAAFPLGIPRPKAPLWEHGATHLFLIRPDGTGRTQITFGSDDDIDDIDPRWSPDGKFVAFARRRRRPPQPPPDNTVRPGSGGIGQFDPRPKAAARDLVPRGSVLVMRIGGVGGSLPPPAPRVLVDNVPGAVFAWVAGHDHMLTAGGRYPVGGTHQNPDGDLPAALGTAHYDAATGEVVGHGVEEGGDTRHAFESERLERPGGGGSPGFYDGEEDADESVTGITGVAGFPNLDAMSIGTLAIDDSPTLGGGPADRTGLRYAADGAVTLADITDKNERPVRLRLNAAARRAFAADLASRPESAAVSFYPPARRKRLIGFSRVGRPGIGSSDPEAVAAESLYREIVWYRYLLVDLDTGAAADFGEAGRQMVWPPGGTATVFSTALVGVSRTARDDGRSIIVPVRELFVRSGSPSRPSWRPVGEGGIYIQGWDWRRAR